MSSATQECRMSSYSKGSLPPAVCFDASISLLNDKNQNAIGFHRLQICKPADGFQLQDSSLLAIDLCRSIATCSVARGHLLLACSLQRCSRAYFARLQCRVARGPFSLACSLYHCPRACFARLQIVMLLAGLFRSLAHCSVARGPVSLACRL